MNDCGGTYVSQVKARSTTAAVQPWINALDAREIGSFDEKIRAQRIADLSNTGVPQSRWMD
jgi:hypothetical protein